MASGQGLLNESHVLRESTAESQVVSPTGEITSLSQSHSQHPLGRARGLPRHNKVNFEMEASKATIARTALRLEGNRTARRKRPERLQNDFTT